MDKEQLNGNSENEEEKVESNSLPQPPIAKTESKKKNTQTIDPFAHGFGNGILRIESPQFENWIVARETKKLISVKLNAVRNKISESATRYADCFSRH